jgi:hypothetical protein
MSSMQSALIAAGVQVPCVKERIWRAIKEHTPRGGVTSGALINQLRSINPGSISSSLNLMANRGMIARSPGTRKSGQIGPVPMVYTTDMERYDLLPPTPKVKNPKALPQQAPQVSDHSQKQEPQAIPSKDSLSLYAENYNSLATALVHVGGAVDQIGECKLSDFLKSAALNGILLTAKVIK